MQNTANKNHYSLNRDLNIDEITQIDRWDIAIIGGGATGLGIAVDAASRGYKTLLVEQSDFAKGTSSRSTKLVHGGVRYLAQGDIKLVYSALKERGILFKNAPHLAHVQSFIIPCYTLFAKLKFLIGLKIYDWMAGKYRIGKSSLLSKERVSNLIPEVRQSQLKGGIEYFDGQFDDARLAINLAQTASQYGATLLNYAKVTALKKDNNGKIKGFTFVDKESNESYTIHAKTVINATGVFVDEILTLAHPNHKPMVRPSQGVHIVVERSFLGGKSALMIPETSDGRVLFGVPWHSHLVLGTTDTPLNEHSLEPRALDTEIDFILNTAGEYLNRKPTRNDALSIFAGLRPLAAPTDDKESTKEISRDHKLIVSDEDLITITGGKWTTYRKMAEETVNQAIKTGQLPPAPCKTVNIKIHGAENQTAQGHWAVYGSDAEPIKSLIIDDDRLAQQLHPRHAHIGAEVVWAVRHEMARTVEDVLARRMRILFLDARAAIEMAPKVAQLMSDELHKDDSWIRQQIASFNDLANGYLAEPFYSKTTDS
ncbi:glycerol-3-phosphate dehydrogenase/oxidase [Olivibacter domesticus]|uniref:Glycerol-3-phosphate dehydrogenase n=1 Tax=Olivibacter domesticus TaxID=407022 RepID=A0A1H7QAA1_OLID1|nr:glycerol-3-phosphate dehydrogenase/oxidase [Olivibacter domesticus]SEL44892.1 glycerol-3-phosphate dehydrogenase [Olivibacter domesticus]